MTATTCSSDEPAATSVVRARSRTLRVCTPTSAAEPGSGPVLLR